VRDDDDRSKIKKKTIGTEKKRAYSHIDSSITDEKKKWLRERRTEKVRHLFSALQYTRIWQTKQRDTR